MRPNRNGNRPIPVATNISCVFSSMSRVSGNATNATTANIADDAEHEVRLDDRVRRVQIQVVDGVADAHLFARHAEKREQEEDQRTSR